MTNTTDSTSSPRLPRRTFLRYAGATSVAGALVLAGCQDTTTDDPAPTTSNGETVSLGSAADVRLLNLLQATKQITAEFYKRVIASPPSGLPPDQLAVLTAIGEHATLHRDFLRAAVNSLRTVATEPLYALGILSFDFSSLNLTDPTAVLNAALTLENLSVRTTVGAIRYFNRATLITTAGKILSVDARHAATLADLLGLDTAATDPQSTAPDARNRTQLPSVSIPLLNAYLASGSRLLVGNLP